MESKRPPTRLTKFTRILSQSHSGDTTERRKAAVALGFLLNHPGAMGRLLELETDEAKEVRVAVLHALEKHRGPR